MKNVRTGAVVAGETSGTSETSKGETAAVKPATVGLKVKTGMRAGDDWEARV